MTIGPTYITIDERMKRGLCSPLQVDGRRAGIWYHHITGTDVLETVYDERAGWKLDRSKFWPQLVPGPSHTGGYFAPGAPLPQPTGRCQDRLDSDAGQDARNWRFTGWSKAMSFPGTPLPDSPAGEWGEFKWIGPRLRTGSPTEMHVPRERMHEMIGARGLGQMPSFTWPSTTTIVGGLAVGLLAAALLWPSKKRWTRDWSKERRW